MGTIERINVFEVDDRYLLKHYFDDTDIYGRMKAYYNHQQYRFEIPPDEIGDVLTFLSKEGFEMQVIDDIDSFIVAVRRYRDHPRNIVRESVMQRTSGDFHCFLMKSQAGVDTAVRSGGKRFTDLDLENPYRSAERD